MCWISVPPSTTLRSCCPPQMPSTGLSACERAFRDGEFEGGAAVLGGDAGMFAARAEKRRIDIEGAASDDEALDQAEIIRRALRLMRQQDRQAAGRDHGGAVILAQRVPGMRLRIAARRLRIEGEADNRLCHGVTLRPPPSQRQERWLCRRRWKWRWSRRARAQARGEVPVGAVLVDAAGNVLASAGNEVEARHDPTAHAEVLVLRAAAALAPDAAARGLRSLCHARAVRDVRGGDRLRPHPPPLLRRL